MDFLDLFEEFLISKGHVKTEERLGPTYTTSYYHPRTRSSNNQLFSITWNFGNTGGCAVISRGINRRNIILYSHGFELGQWDVTLPYAMEQIYEASYQCAITNGNK